MEADFNENCGKNEATNKENGNTNGNLCWKLAEQREMYSNTYVKMFSGNENQAYCKTGKAKTESSV